MAVLPLLRSIIVLYYILFLCNLLLRLVCCIAAARNIVLSTLLPSGEKKNECLMKIMLHHGCISINDLTLENKEEKQKLRSKSNMLTKRKSARKDRTKMKLAACENKMFRNSLKYPRNPASGRANVYTILCIILSGIFLSFFISIRCCDKLDPVILKNVLKENVFGQNKAVEHIVSALENDESKLLIIYGGTGVGKSYSVSLIFHNNWNNSNVFYYAIPPSIDILISKTYWASLLCSSVILVFDGLGSDDFDIVSKVESIFAMSTNHNITVIIIFNCDEVNSYFKKTCDNTFRTKLIDKFSAVPVSHKEYIKFETLSQVHLRQCIDEALDGHKLEEHQFQNLEKNFNVDMDGCKGVQSKVQLFIQSS